MPLTQAEMDFFTRHAYELFNFDRPMLAHEYLRQLYGKTGVGIPWKVQQVFQYLWQEQGRYDGTADTFFSWAPPDDLPPLNPPWRTWAEFEARSQDLYPEMVYRQFESSEHPLRYPHFVATRRGRFKDDTPVFTPEENVFLDAYYREIFSFKGGPCLDAVVAMAIEPDEINTLVSYRATELIHAGMQWPQLDEAGPPIPWPSLEEFKKRHFPPRPNAPHCSYVTLHRPDLSAKEHVFIAHYYRELMHFSPGPAYGYLQNHGIPPAHLAPYLKEVFKYAETGYLHKFSTDPLKPFVIPWANREIFYRRSYGFCKSLPEQKRFLESLPPDLQAFLEGARGLRWINDHEEQFVEWYVAESTGRTDKTGGQTPATNWLWTNGIYPTNMKVLVVALDHYNTSFYHDAKYDNPLWPFKPAWADKEEFDDRLTNLLAAYPEFQSDPTAQPNYVPEGYEERRMEWLRSIPSPPALDSFPPLRMPC